MSTTVVLPPEPVEPFPTRRQASARPRGKRASDKPAGGARKNLRLSCFCCVPELAQPVPVMVAVRGKALVSELLGELTAAAAPQLGSRIFEFLQVFDCNSVVTVDPSTPVEWVRQTGTQIFAICQQPWVPGADGGADGAGAYAAPPENNTAYLPPGVAYAGGPPISAAMGAEAYPISAEQAYGNAPMSPMSPHSPYGYYDAGYDAGYEYGYDGVAYAPMSPMGHSPMSPMAPPLPPMWVNMANGGAVGGAPPIAAPPPARRDEPPAPAFEGERAELDAAMAFARSVPKEVREMRGRELADAKADHVGRAAANGRCSELAAQLGWLVATSGRYKTSLCKTHEERPDGGIVTMCTYGAKCMFAHGRRDRRRDPLVFTYEAELCPSLAAGRECRAPSGGRDTTCAYAHAVVEVRTHPLTMLRELKAGRTPDLLRSTQRAEYPESPGRMGSPLKAPHKLMNAPVCMPVAPPPPAAAAPPAAVEAAGAQTAAAAAPRVALRLSAAGKEMVLLEIVSAETSAADAACVECH